MLPFSIGFGELFVIAVVVLLVVGPAKLPQIARTLGSGVRMARRATRELQDAIQTEDLKKPLIKPWEEVVKARDDVMESILSVEAEVVEGNGEMKPATQHEDLDQPSAPSIALKPVAGAVAQSPPEHRSTDTDVPTVKSDSPAAPEEQGTADG